MACHLLADQAHGIRQPHQESSNQAGLNMTLETIISVGVFGWMAMGMLLMGLGIW